MLKEKPNLAKRCKNNAEERDRSGLVPRHSLTSG